MPLTNQYKKVRDCVVQVVALNGQNIVGSGSGSVIGAGNHVLTCDHCIVDGAQMAIIDPANSTNGIHGNVIFRDSNSDIAILEFTNVVGKPVVFSDSSNCEVGNGAFVVGYPMNIMEQVLLSAHIASITTSLIRIDSSVNHGNSGGPLFNLAGEQIGVVNAKHGSLSNYLNQLMNAKPTMSMQVGGIDPVQSIQVLIGEMQKNLNLGIGYAVPSKVIKQLHPMLTKLIP
ncbi:S1 family peptidase [Gallaecimonas xiamenensis]|uniref:S1 family peptidase n=1 Tax=Gallaecimonas xiamenensis TaxID=1207039 RepID=UPI0009FF16F2|nr:serine protease [Gallaecimonas xiamenensis]